MSAIPRAQAIDLLIFSRSDRHEKVLQGIPGAEIMFSNFVSDAALWGEKEYLEKEKTLVAGGVELNRRERERNIQEARKNATTCLITDLFKSCYNDFSDEDLTSMSQDLKRTNEELDVLRMSLDALEEQKIQQFIEELGKELDDQFEEAFEDDYNI